MIIIGISQCFQFSRSVVSDFLQPHGLQHGRPPGLSPTPGVYWKSCPLSQGCHETISSSLYPFFSRLQSFPASGSFQMSQLFTLGGQNIRVSASASVLPMTIQDWFPLGWIDRISLQTKGLSRVFSNTTVQKHQFFGASFLYSPTLTSIHDYWKNHSFDYTDFCEQSWTIKTTEHQRIDTLKLWCSERLLRVPWTARRSNQSILKQINPE